MKRWINRRRKGILAATTAVLVLFIDAESADVIVGALGVILTYAVPNKP